MGLFGGRSDAVQTLRDAVLKEVERSVQVRWGCLLVIRSFDLSRRWCFQFAIGNRGNYPPWSFTARPWKQLGPQKERIVFQPSIFRGELLVSGRVWLDDFNRRHACFVSQKTYLMIRDLCCPKGCFGSQSHQCKTVWYFLGPKSFLPTTSSWWWEGINLELKVYLDHGFNDWFISLPLPTWGNDPIWQFFFNKWVGSTTN